MLAAGDVVFLLDVDNGRFATDLEQRFGAAGLDGDPDLLQTAADGGDVEAVLTRFVQTGIDVDALALQLAKRTPALLDNMIPEFSVRLGGTTSVDATKPGIDKAYGIRKLRDILGIAIQEMIFVGDALFPGGNDYPAKEAGAMSIQVRDPNESKRVIEAIVACLDGVQHRKRREDKSR